MADKTAANRLLIVSNRLPVSARADGAGVRLVEASGGLATGLRGWHRQSDAVWIGWPGDVDQFSAEQRRDLEARLQHRRVAPVFLSAAQVERYYDGFSNRVLWPLFHYLVD